MADWFDASNADQAQAWNGVEGERWTEHADRYDAACARFDRPLLSAAKIADGDRVLDIGCGCGLSTRGAARLTHRGSVLGVDLSAKMLERARARSEEENLDNTVFEHGDAQVFPFARGSFAGAISRFGCMFF